jgi:flavin-binding protein dodecin
MDRVYKKIEVVGTSDKSVTDAIQAAIRRASESVKHISWFEVDEIRGAVENNNVQQYQVTLKVGFRIEE